MSPGLLCLIKTTADLKTGPRPEMKNKPRTAARPADSFEEKATDRMA